MYTRSSDYRSSSPTVLLEERTLLVRAGLQLAEPPDLSVSGSSCDVAISQGWMISNSSHRAFLDVIANSSA